MGTNYYLYKNECKYCGRADEPLHIGKSSAGWVFLLHVIPEKNINTLEDWQRKWNKENVFIKNEYDELISNFEMLEIITNRMWPHGDKCPWGYDSWDDFHYINESEKGPNGLVRNKIKRHCVGHGEGTWDYIEGEFS